MDTACNQNHRDSPCPDRETSGPPPALAPLPVAVLLLALLVSVPGRRPLWMALALAYAAASGVSLASGWTAGALIGLSVSGLKKVWKVMLLLALINAAIATWLGCGSVQSMVYYGLRTASGS